jgi:hypothetical protein
MPGLGRKTWSPGDTLNAADVNGYLMDQSVMVFAGTAARASAIPTPSAGMVAYSTATSLQVYNGSAWVDLSTGYGVATGGSATSITVGGTAYTLLTFTSDSTLTVTKSGLFDVLLVGGGAGGAAAADSAPGGGGGAGQYYISTAYFEAGSLTVDVGAGGAAASSGFSSQIGTATNGVSASGGGRGNPLWNLARGESGGSGGGTYASNIGFAMGFGGHNGGSSTGSPFSAGGGGGAGAVAGNGTAGVGGAGGAGVQVNTFISGASLFKGGGGGGASSTGGAGGSSIGGAGASGSGAGGTAAANTGSGGGGGYSAGGAGGSGIIYVRFKV